MTFSNSRHKHRNYKMCCERKLAWLNMLTRDA